MRLIDCVNFQKRSEYPWLCQCDQWTKTLLKIFTYPMKCALNLPFFRGTISVELVNLQLYIYYIEAFQSRIAVSLSHFDCHNIISHADNQDSFRQHIPLYKKSPSDSLIFRTSVFDVVLGCCCCSNYRVPRSITDTLSLEISIIRRRYFSSCRNERTWPKSSWRATFRFSFFFFWDYCNV